MSGISLPPSIHKQTSSNPLSRPPQPFFLSLHRSTHHSYRPVGPRWTLLQLHRPRRDLRGHDGSEMRCNKVSSDGRGIPVHRIPSRPIARGCCVHVVSFEAGQLPVSERPRHKPVLSTPTWAIYLGTADLRGPKLVSWTSLGC